MPSLWQTEATWTPRARLAGLSSALCAAGQPLFFELLHLQARPLAGQLREGSFQRQINVGVGQRALQPTNSVFKPL